MYKIKGGEYETKLVNSVLTKLYSWFKVPMKIIFFGLLLIHTVFYVALFLEDSDKFCCAIKSIICVVNLLLILHISILAYIVISTEISPRITKPKFLELEQRFTKEELSKFSHDMKNLLSYSHCTEEDLKRFLVSNNRENEIENCKICKEIKIYAMAHCRHCNKCVYRYDHHCPWFNNCIGVHNINYYCSFLLYCSSLVLMNMLAFSLYTKSETYNSHYLVFRGCIFINVLCIYFFFYFFVGNGRSISEVVLELIVDPFPPKYKLFTNWRENMYLVLGTWKFKTALLIPYWYKPAITGLEFGFLPQSNEPKDFLQELIDGIKLWWYKGKRSDKKDD